jgi:hypothetical protein
MQDQHVQDQDRDRQKTVSTGIETNITACYICADAGKHILQGCLLKYNAASNAMQLLPRQTVGPRRQDPSISMQPRAVRFQRAALGPQQPGCPSTTLYACDKKCYEPMIMRFCSGKTTSAVVINFDPLLSQMAEIYLGTIKAYHLYLSNVCFHNRREFFLGNGAIALRSSTYYIANRFVCHCYTYSANLKILASGLILNGKRLSFKPHRLNKLVFSHDNFDLIVESIS